MFRSGFQQNRVNDAGLGVSTGREKEHEKVNCMLSIDNGGGIASSEHQPAQPKENIQIMTIIDPPVHLDESAGWRVITPPHPKKRFPCEHVIKLALRANMDPVWLRLVGETYLGTVSSRTLSKPGAPCILNKNQDAPPTLLTKHRSNLPAYPLAHDYSHPTWTMS